MIVIGVLVVAGMCAFITGVAIAMAVLKSTDTSIDT